MMHGQTNIKLTVYIRPTETLSSNANDTAASIQCVLITNRFSAVISQTPWPRKPASLKPF